MNAKKALVWMVMVLSLMAALPACAQETPPATPPPVAQPQAPTAEPQQQHPVIIINPQDLFELFGGGPSPRMLEATYHQVWNRIASSYYDVDALKNWGDWQHKYDGKLTTVEETDAAIKAMVSSLHDRWTQYYSPDDQEEAMENRLAGNTDLGFMLRPRADGVYTVHAVEFGSAAYNSPLQPGDVVKSIAGTEISKLSQDEVDALLSAPTGSKVTVVYLDNGKEVPVELTATELPEPQVEARLLPGNIVYLRLPDFEHEQFVYQLPVEAAKVLKQLKGEPAGLILDLRFNLGGEYELALQTASLFLDKGTVVNSMTRSGRVITEQKERVIPVQPFMLPSDPAQRQAIDMFQHKPMVLLVNGSTASSSEIVTGALKDAGRVRTVGTNTVGKGVGYEEQQLMNGGGLRVTTLKYHTPNGTDVSVAGITPDKVVQQPRDRTDKQLEAGLAELKDLIGKSSQATPKK